VKRETHNTTYTDEQKAAAVAEYEAGGSAAEIAKRLGITASGLYYWKKKLKEKGRESTAVVAVPVQNTESQQAIREATILLRRAKHSLLDGIKDGTIDDLDSTHLLSLLALQSLQGK
jgi:transposase-like protein